MAERIKKDEYNLNKLVIERFLLDDMVTLKDGLNLELGTILIQDNTDGKYKKLETNDELTSNLRIYSGDRIENTNNTKVGALRQGRVDEKLLKGLPEKTEARYWQIKNELEKHNIILEEVK